MRYAIAALMVVHGLIHAMGFAGAYELAEFEGPSKTPTNFVAADVGSPMLKVLGALWLVALAAFLLAAALLLADASSWRAAAVTGATISTVLVALWWQDAPFGALANALVIAAVVAAPQLEGVAA
jgi:hypothetical protein